MPVVDEPEPVVDDDSVAAGDAADAVRPLRPTERAITVDLRASAGTALV